MALLEDTHMNRNLMKAIAIPVLQKLGYEYWYENPDPERMFFMKGMPPFGESRTHHVHIVEPTSKHWRDKIFFRDHLIAHPEIAQAYQQLKLKLTQEYATDREAYTNAKSKFINKVLQKNLLAKKLLSKPRLIKAILSDYPVIQNMARFYVYDMSRTCGFISEDWVCPKNGLYESFDFKGYFEENDRYAFLIKIDDELVGFVLINKASILRKNCENSFFNIF